MTAIDQIYSLVNTFQMIIMYGWPFLILVIILICKIKWKNWVLEAVIIEKRGNNLIKTEDRCAKYTDPYSGLVGYKLQKFNETIPIVNFEWILHHTPKPSTLIERFVNLVRGNVGTIFLFKYGTKQYKPIWITNNTGRRKVLREIKDKDNNTIFIDVYEQFDPRRHLGALDFQVIDWDNMNFMVQEQRASFERRQKKKDFWNSVVIPLGMILICGLICIIMIKFSYDYAMSMANMGKTETKTNTNSNPLGNLIPAG